MEIKEILGFYRDLVWEEIDRYLVQPEYPADFSVDKKFGNEIDLHQRLMREYPERKGKYLRPTLLILTAEAMGVKTDMVVRLAGAMQVSEDWILNHDDIEDNSLLRRGKDTLHRIYGKELAINAGDALQMVMWKMLFDCRKELGEIVQERVVDEFYRMLMRTALGQTVELSWTKNKKWYGSDEEWYFVADGKTAYYSVAGPMRLGAMVGGASDEQLKVISKFGIYLGRCFQLVDDVLDVTGDFGGLKQKGNDIYEGKMTVVLSHLFREIGDERKKLKAIMAKMRDEKTEKEVVWVMEKMKKCGSIDYAMGLAKENGKMAKMCFEKELGFLMEVEARKKLEILIDFVLKRDH
jgi:geranylgeranyl diphosphate synthase, type II